jgi:hypothetical protein
MKNKKVITLRNSGKSSWIGGAYCKAFVTSNKGNFVLRGYLAECEQYIEDQKNFKGWVVYNLLPNLGGRFIIRTYGVPYKISFNDKVNKYEFYDKSYETITMTKRLPKNFVNNINSKIEMSRKRKLSKIKNTL